LPVIEEGRFRFIPNSFTSFNLFLYPDKGAKYHYNFTGKTNELMNAEIFKTD